MKQMTADYTIADLVKELKQKKPEKRMQIVPFIFMDMLHLLLLFNLDYSEDHDYSDKFVNHMASVEKEYYMVVNLSCNQLELWPGPKNGAEISTKVTVDMLYKYTGEGRITLQGDQP